MHKSYPYRLKTSEEFQKEFGIDWRHKVLYSFPSFMDYLLGTDYPYQLSEQDFNCGYLNDVSGYSISKGMLIDKIKKPNYNPRKIIKDI